MGGGEVEKHTNHDLKGHHLVLAWPPGSSSDNTKDAFIARIKERFPALEVTAVDSSKGGDVSKDLWHKTTILSTFGTLPEEVSSVPRLEFIHLLSAGSNHLAALPIYTDTEITITTSSGIHGPAISEWVILTLLSYAHRFPVLLKWRGENHWPPGQGDDRHALKGVADYAGSTLAVLGYGSIGRQVARVASAMGMRVLAYTASEKVGKEGRRDDGFIVPGTGDREGEIPAEWLSGLEKENLHRFLGQDFDVLVICVPLTEQTKGFLGEEEFKILGRKDGRHPFVVNIARGQIIVQSALIKALRAYEESSKSTSKTAENGEDSPSGQDLNAEVRDIEGIRGAALDVTDPEPLDQGNELWKAPNLFISPHVSGTSVAYLDRAALVLEGNLEKFSKGERLWNVVDRKRGY